MQNSKLNIYVNHNGPLGHLKDRTKYNFYYDLDSNFIYDAALFINTPPTKIEIKVKEGNVFCLIGEPAYKANYLKGHNLYMYKGLSQYDKVFSVIKNAKNVIEGQAFLGWFQNKYSYDDWTKLSLPKKNKEISCISSNHRATSGHRLRYDFVEYLKKEINSIDFFGRGYKNLEDKHEGLREYKYSIAIENGVFKNYFSEKIMDCFLNYTVPIYYGCTNISEFFPENSYILIDIKNKEKAKEEIENIIKNDNYENRLEALKKARSLVLEQYNVYSLIEKEEDYILKNLDNKVKKYKIKPIVSLELRVKTFVVKNLGINKSKIKKLWKNI